MSYFMRDFRSLTVWTILLNLLIPVGLGHGLAPMGMLEIFFLFDILTQNFPHYDYFSWSLTGAYEQSLGAAALLFSAGQILLFISLVINRKGKRVIILLALAVMGAGFYYLIHRFADDTAAQ